MKKSLWKPRRIVGGLAGPLVLLAVIPAPANAYPRPGRTERVSVASNGAEGNGFSFVPSISADGRHVAFQSLATNLVPGDTNDAVDVFVRDRATGALERVSVASDGTEANDDSTPQPGIPGPAISADGRYVAFDSLASNLVPGDANGASDIFVRDRETGTTERVSVAAGGIEGSGYSLSPAISADGRHVAFRSSAPNLVPGDTNGTWDVFVHDLENGAIERVSVATGGTEGNDMTLESALSANGRHVAFRTLASNLVPGDTNGTWDILVHDRDTGTTERVAVATGGAQANGESRELALSADGRHVAFRSTASNLVPGDRNGTWDIFVHDLETGITERVSVASNGTEANEQSFVPTLSADGRLVAFGSVASNLVPGDTNATWDDFVHDRATGSTQRMSLASSGAQGNSFSSAPAISADGRHVAFVSVANNLVAGDGNGASDIFVHDRGPATGVGAIEVQQAPGEVLVSGWATFSGTTMASAQDPEDDGEDALGAELTGAALIHRPEQEDLLVRLDLSSLPSDAAGSGLPGILYGAELQVGETRYEVRALRVAATRLLPRIPHLALYRCAPDCTEHALLTGSFGTTGTQVLVSVPLSALGAAESTQLTGLRAFTAAGEAAPGTLLGLDEVSLISSEIPVSRVELSIAPASTPGAEVAFTVEADLVAGDFSGTIPTAGLSPGSYRVWARVCLGDACGPATFEEVAL